MKVLLWICRSLLVAVGLFFHITGDEIEDPGLPAGLKVSVTAHELVDGGDGGVEQLEQEDLGVKIKIINKYVNI